MQHGGMRRGARLLVVLAMLVGMIATSSFGVPRAGAISTTIVISQVYGGGGNSGAPYTNDFIELYNLGASAINLTGFSVQYASAAGTFSSANVHALSGTINPGKYFLIQEASGGASGVPLPTPDLSSGPLNLSATNGKVALVSSTTALTCGASCASGVASVVDFIGYGSANDHEGAAAAPVLSNTTAALRAGNGATDTDSNAVDFSAVAPCPRNTATAGAGSCGGVVTGTPAKIYEIQGAAHLSPKSGMAVINVPGIVTAKATNGFYLQDATGDGDPATSDGIFVFTSGAPTVSVGDSVTVNGTVSEFRPGGSGGTNNLSTTEITTPTITPVSMGNPLPAPVVISGQCGTTANCRTIPGPTIEDDAVGGNVENAGSVFDPATDALDFYESLEGMRVQVNDAVAVGPRNSFGESPVLPDNGAGVANRTARGGVYLTGMNDMLTNANPQRVILDDELLKVINPGGTPPLTPALNVGDTLPGATVGIVSYSFGNFMLEVTSIPAVQAGGLTPEVTAAQGANQLAVATFNVQNLSHADPPSKFSGLATVIVTNLKAPDIVALEEVQDNTGPTDDGVVDATTTANTLIAAIQAAGGPTYQYRDIVPVNDQDGGQPGGNIRVGFLFRTDRGLGFVDRNGGSSTRAVGVADDTRGAYPTQSPGRIDPTNPAWTSSRKPLVGEFSYNGNRLIVIANHFISKGGDTPLFGRIQPQQTSSETQRIQQATVEHAYIQSLLVRDPNANIVVLGDLNDFQFASSVGTLENGVLTDLVTTLPANEQYTYEFEGNAQVLDHILVSAHLNQPSLQYDIVHTNAEFATQVSDHEPQVVRLTLTPIPAIDRPTPNGGLAGTTTDVTITGGRFVSGATVTFDGIAATNVVVVNDTTITVTAPAHAVGDVDVVVTNPGGGTARTRFTYYPPNYMPTIPPHTSASPAPNATPNPGSGSRPTAPTVAATPNISPPRR